MTEPFGSPENLERFSLLGYDAHKIEHMHHDYSILAYEMKGKPLPELNGAPLRRCNELELGFNRQAVEFVATFRDLGSGKGGFNEANEYYGGPI